MKRKQRAQRRGLYVLPDDMRLHKDGRTCGDCGTCCTVYEIDDPELKKPAGVRCDHLTDDNRCGIYERRPLVCREFECMWIKGLGPQRSRPDRIGAVSAIVASSLPRPVDAPEVPGVLGPHFAGTSRVMCVTLADLDADPDHPGAAEPYVETLGLFMPVIVVIAGQPERRAWFGPELWARALANAMLEEATTP